jgi:Transglutaminase-like superfamily
VESLHTLLRLQITAINVGDHPVEHYCLSSHTYACEPADGIIFLDVRHHRYFGVPSSLGITLRAFVRNWPAAQDLDHTSDARTPEALQALVDAGLLMASDSETANIRRLPQRAEATVCCASPMAAPARIGVGNVCNVIRAVALTAVRLRTMSLERIVNLLQARSARAVDGPQPLSEDALRAFVRVYMRVRPWLYTARNSCLLDSLALLEFLHVYKIYPLWVIGVQALPFRAHSWVQLEHLVLNDFAENVNQFSPILVV